MVDVAAFCLGSGVDDSLRSAKRLDQIEVLSVEHLTEYSSYVRLRRHSIDNKGTRY